MTTDAIRVVCVEDNQLVSGAIARKLDGREGFEWLGSAETREAFLKLIDETSPTVVCMDFAMPGQDPFVMMEDLASRHPECRVLFLSGYVTHECIERAISAGAWGYLSKGDDPRIIVESIQRVAAGSFVLGDIARQHYRGAVPARGKPPLPRVEIPKQSTGFRALRRFFSRTPPGGT
jgi:two-component system invasion response regulator UvrY